MHINIIVLKLLAGLSCPPLSASKRNTLTPAEPRQQSSRPGFDRPRPQPPNIRYYALSFTSPIFHSPASAKVATRPRHACAVGRTQRIHPPPSTIKSSSPLPKGLVVGSATSQLPHNSLNSLLHRHGRPRCRLRLRLRLCRQPRDGLLGEPDDVDVLAPQVEEEALDQEGDVLRQVEDGGEEGEGEEEEEDGPYIRLARRLGRTGGSREDGLERGGEGGMKGRYEGGGLTYRRTASRRA